MKNRVVILGFIGFILFAVSFSLMKSSSADYRTLKTENMISPKVLDSIINDKIDYRYTSYDSKFMYENLVVINTDSVIIGKLILYTSIKDLDSFYNSNIDWRKTRLYHTVKDGSFKILAEK